MTEEQPEQEPPGQQQPPAAAGDTAKGKKRKLAVFFCYLGAGYHGMQRQPGKPTLEEELERALTAAGAISPDNAGDFFKISWMRAARTDKDVSALCQVVSAKLVADPAETFVERVNAALPGKVRCLGFYRVTAGFDARKMADKRRYEYLIPAWAFQPDALTRSREDIDAAAAAAAAGGAAPVEGEATAAAADDSNNAGAAAEGHTPPPAAAAAAAGGSGPVPGGRGRAQRRQPEDGAAKEERLRRIRQEVVQLNAAATWSPAQAAQLNALLAQYVGTHNFHNFTAQGKVDPLGYEAKRHMLEVTSPGTVDIGGVPWVKVSLVGQSFILHQIRKMVGLVVAVMRGLAPPNAIQMALAYDKDYNVPTAPGLGLYLCEVYYSAYNARFAGLHGAVQYGPFEAAAEAFKREQLYPHMAAKDAEDLVNALWVKNLTEEQYRFSTWASQPSVRVYAKPPAKRPPPSAAATVAAQETYGLGRSPNTEAAAAGRAAKQQCREGQGAGAAQQQPAAAEAAAVAPSGVQPPAKKQPDPVDVELDSLYD